MAEQASENDGDLWMDAMAAGDFERAWQVSDRVLHARKAATPDDPRVPYHLRFVWDGSAIDASAVLVRCYHGLGDTLQFCRYLPALRRRARRVTLEAQAELIPLLSTMAGIDRIVAFDPARPLPPDECTLEIMELAHALRTRPDPSPYLAVEADRRPGLRVGFCWRGGPTWRPERSLPDALAAALPQGDGVEWVSLQRGAALPGLADDCPAEILHTARRIAGLDLVVSVDTMIAHLAGALGVPLRLLLSDPPDWRWLAGGDGKDWSGGDGKDWSGRDGSGWSGGSVWYRDVRQYRQEQPGVWGPPLAALAADLTATANKGTLRFGVSF